MGLSLLSPEDFRTAITICSKHLRLKGDDQWEPREWAIKIASFRASFPEVSGLQLIWAAERWVQATEPSTFHRLPTWNELCSHLFKTTHAGEPSRVLGFREDLPDRVRPTAQQELMLPAPPPAPAVAADPKPPALPAEGALTLDEVWDLYLRGEYDPFPPAEAQVRGFYRTMATPAMVEKSLREGLGDVRSWNLTWKPGETPMFPRLFFIEENPQFRDLDFRDMEAFRLRALGAEPGSPMASMLF